MRVVRVRPSGGACVRTATAAAAFDRERHGIAVSADHRGVQQLLRAIVVAVVATRRLQGLAIPELLRGRGGPGKHASREAGRDRGRPERPSGGHLHRLSDAIVVPVRAAQVAVVPRQIGQNER